MCISITVHKYSIKPFDSVSAVSFQPCGTLNTNCKSLRCVNTSVFSFQGHGFNSQGMIKCIPSVQCKALLINASDRKCINVSTEMFQIVIPQCFDTMMLKDFIYHYSIHQLKSHNSKTAPTETDNGNVYILAINHLNIIN